MTTKTNYTDEQVQTLRDNYVGADNTTELPQLAEQVGKSVPSVRAKLSQMGLYVTPEKAEAGTHRETKADKAAEIAGIIELNEPETEALAKTTNAVLDKIRERLING